MTKQVAQCPACKARYSVTPGQLRIANGKVRCGQCLTVFDALQRPATPPLTPRTPPSSPATSPVQPEPKRQETTAKAIPPQPADPLALLSQLRADPPELHRRPPPSRRYEGWAFSGSVLALLLLAGQYLWFERAQLSSDPWLTDAYQWSCQYLDCTLPSQSGLKGLQTTHVLVRQLDSPDDALELLTGLHNTHSLPVSLPQLRIHFSDSSGRILAARDLLPAEYLPGSDNTQIEPGARLNIRLMIQRPATGHLGYEIDWIANPEPEH